ncbi:transporter substrate-binding domain-containing protein [Hydrogenophaga sp. PAMC20947]|uniref:PAS domain S-box protein n=1 Tax=Hydrogenophaga sp. PAMC20947 TaxID=2565558 RepID=UPI0014474172|nr:transporter substrate-binding domain-containing protein [Hydrogenophaga sp. PAMC20947]
MPLESSALTAPVAGALMKKMAHLRLRGKGWMAMLLLGWTAAWAQAPGTPAPVTALPPLLLGAEEQAWLDQHPVIRIGVDPAYAPYAFFGPDDQPAGIAAEISALVAQQLGVRFEPVRNLSWPDILEAARLRKLDLITTANRSPEREAYLAFSKKYLPTPTVIMTRSDAVRLRNTEALSGQRVALVKAYSSTRAFLDRVPGATPVFVDTPLAGLLAVSAGTAEAYVGVVGINTYLASQSGLSNLAVNTVFDPDNGQNFAVRSDWAPLAPLLDKALASIPPDRMQAIFARWIPITHDQLITPTATLTPHDRTLLAKLPELRVGVLSNRPPFDFINPDGKHVGVSEDTLTLIRQRTGLKTRLVVADHMSDLIQLYQQGDVDLIAAVNSATPAALAADLTEPYFVTALGVFVPRGEVFLGDLSGLLDSQVAVSQEGYANEVLSGFPRIVRVPRASIAQAAQAVLSRDAVYMVAETSSALRSIEEAGLHGLSYAGPLSELPMKLHIAVSPRYAPLRPILNTVLSSISNEEAARVRRQWVGAHVEGGIATRWVLMWGLLLAAFASAGYLAFYGHNRRLRQEITLRTQMSRQLADAHAERDEAAQRFRTMVDTSPNALLLVDQQGRIAQATANAVALFGYTQNELLGQPIELLLPEHSTAAHIKLRDDYIASQSPGRQMNLARDVVARHQTGRPIPVEIRLSPLAFPEGRYVLASVLDITERHETQRQLRESEERFRDLFDHASDLIYVLDLSQEFVYVNASWCKTLGYTAQEANAKPLMEVIAPECQPYAAALREKSMQGENHALVQMVLLTRDKERIEVEGNITQKMVDGKSVSSRGIFRDVTARNRQIAELAVAKQKAEAADHIKSAFLASMSHELRTPLNSVIGFTGILLKRLAGPLNDEQAFQMGIVRESARNLLALVNDVLDISRIEAGELRVAHEPFDLRASIEKTVATVQPLADAASLSLTTDIIGPVDITTGDMRRTEQVLLNLLGNAIKFTRIGGIQLQAEAVDEQWFKVSVTDTGIGIAEADLPILFQPFRQVDNRLARQHEGSGLGLAISLKLAELMGGRLEVQSELGKGSTFTLWLPRTAPAFGNATPTLKNPA